MHVTDEQSFCNMGIFKQRDQFGSLGILPMRKNIDLFDCFYCLYLVGGQLNFFQFSFKMYNIDNMYKWKLI